MLLGFYFHGIVHNEFAPKGHTVNCQRGCFEAFERSCESCKIGIVGGEAMDSSPRQCNRAFCFNLALVFGANIITVLEHTLYSPDLAP